MNIYHLHVFTILLIFSTSAWSLDCESTDTEFKKAGYKDVIRIENPNSVTFAGNRGDAIIGTSGPDTILGGNGKDFICGNGGADTLDGGNGKDIIYGGAGFDSIVGGNGKDTCSGEEFDSCETEIDEGGSENVTDAEIIPVDGLVPDPGEAGMLTVEGIDSDGDGVRDDAQRLIAVLDYDSIEETNAMRQAAIAAQQVILYGANISDLSIQDVGNQSARSGDCLYDVFGDNFMREYNALMFVMLNTEDRSAAMEVFSTESVGRIYASNKPGEACE